MCGIVGVLGQHQAAPLLVEALKRLEYRGYDSAGIATVEDGRLDRRRAVGKLVNDDVPAPMEFTLNRAASWRHNRSAYRKLHLVYERHGYLGDE